jgi:hypothetical protein
VNSLAAGGVGLSALWPILRRHHGAGCAAIAGPVPLLRPSHPPAQGYVRSSQPISFDHDRRGRRWPRPVRAERDCACIGLSGPPLTDAQRPRHAIRGYRQDVMSLRNPGVHNGASSIVYASCGPALLAEASGANSCGSLTSSALTSIDVVSPDCDVFGTRSVMWICVSTRGPSAAHGGVPLATQQQGALT